MSLPNTEKKEPQEKTTSLMKQFIDDYEFGYRESNRTSHKLLWISFIFVVIAITWSYFAIIDEVTVAQGQVVPSKQIQLIQNLEGGIIKEILVEKGKIVEKGQILAYLDNTQFSSDVNAKKQKADALQIRVIRLTAEANNKPFVIPDALRKTDPDLATSELSLYQTRINQLKALQRRRDLIVKEINMTEPLIKEGAVSKVEVLRLQQGLDDINGQILAFQSTALDELNKSKAELSALQQDSLGMQDRLARTTIKSPVKGIINQIYINTIGGIIKPGENILDIVPLDDTLLIEAKVRPSDIGFIHPGDNATVKISAYDFSIYGGLDGKVEHISADTLKEEKTDKKEENYYEIWVRTNQNYIKSPEGKLLYIIPGMTASVDILTGHKTVLDYILKPIIKAKQTALRER